MTSAARKILEVALALPEEDRRRIGEAILDSVQGDAADDIRQAWQDEAVRRVEEIERGEGKLVDLDEALRSLRADLRHVRHE